MGAGGCNANDNALRADGLPASVAPHEQAMVWTARGCRMRLIASARANRNELRNPGLPGEAAVSTLLPTEGWRGGRSSQRASHRRRTSTGWRSRYPRRSSVLWRARQDSNPRPSGPKPLALSTELQARAPYGTAAAGRIVVRGTGATRSATPDQRSLGRRPTTHQPIGKTAAASANLIASPRTNGYSPCRSASPPEIPVAAASQGSPAT